MRWVWVIGCLVVAVAAYGCSEAPRQCKRPAATSDIFIDVRGQDVTILAANVAGDCIIVFPNSLRMKREADSRDPWYVYIRVEDMDGNVLTHVADNSLLPEGWWSPMVLDSDEPETTDVIELKPGTLRAKRWSISGMLSGLSAAGIDLPRGRPLRMQLWVFLPPYPPDLYRGASASGVSAKSNAFLHTIP